MPLSPPFPSDLARRVAAVEAQRRRFRVSGFVLLWRAGVLLSAFVLVRCPDPRAVETRGWSSALYWRGPQLVPWAGLQRGTPGRSPSRGCVSPGGLSRLDHTLRTNARGMISALRGGTPSPLTHGKWEHGDAMGAGEITLLVEGLAKQREADERVMAELRSRVTPRPPQPLTPLELRPRTPHPAP